MNRPEIDIDELRERARAFHMMELPGQIPAMHMGTAYLVSDLEKALLSWKEYAEYLEEQTDA